jgi:hypothetical protein
VAVLPGSLRQLRLKVLEAHRRDQQAVLARSTLAGALLLITTLVVYIRRDNFIHGKYCELLDLGCVQIRPEYQLSYRVNVVLQALVKEKVLAHLQLHEMFEQ